MKKDSEAEVRIKCVFLFHFSHLFRWVNRSRSECLFRCRWRQSGIYVSNVAHTMVQGLLVAWWFSGEFDKFANLSHDSNDRCDRVGAEEVSGPVLENTVGPPGRSVQLQVCQWCCKENWRFEFVDGGWWSSNSKKRHIGRAGNLRRPENWYWYVRWDANFCRKQFLKIFTSSNTYLL